jgi:Holliday junction resolvasome RuvABC ATP-dependent DNA helicase subunit
LFPDARLRQVEGAEILDLASAKRDLDLLEVDEHGSDDLDRRILSILIEMPTPMVLTALTKACGIP